MEDSPIVRWKIRGIRYLKNLDAVYIDANLRNKTYNLLFIMLNR